MGLHTPYMYQQKCFEAAFENDCILGIHCVRVVIVPSGALLHEDYNILIPRGKGELWSQCAPCASARKIHQQIVPEMAHF